MAQSVKATPAPAPAIARPTVDVPPETRPLDAAVRALARAAQQAVRALRDIHDATPAGHDNTRAAGLLASALADYGAALHDEQSGWQIKQALDRPAELADADGLDGLARFASLFIDMMRAGYRRSRLGLGAQVGLVRFATVASRHDVQRTAMEEMEAERRQDEAERQATGILEIESNRRQSAPRRHPAATASIPDDVIGVDGPRV